MHHYCIMLLGPQLATKFGIDVLLPFCGYFPFSK